MMWSYLYSSHKRGKANLPRRKCLYIYSALWRHNSAVITSLQGELCPSHEKKIDHYWIVCRENSFSAKNIYTFLQKLFVIQFEFTVICGNTEPRDVRISFVGVVVATFGYRLKLSFPLKHTKDKWFLCNVFYLFIYLLISFLHLYIDYASFFMYFGCKH